MPMLVALGFIFDPAWVPASRGGRSDRVFYDGHCGLCHGVVRFLLAESRDESSFRFGPLQGESFAREFPGDLRESLPHSFVVVSDVGRLSTRSAAVLLAAGHLGGAWRMMSVAARLVPRVVRDAVYDGVARIRYRVFGTRDEVCPVIPDRLRERFEL